MTSTTSPSANTKKKFIEESQEGTLKDPVVLRAIFGILLISMLPAFIAFESQISPDLNTILGLASMVGLWAGGSMLARLLWGARWRFNKSLYDACINCNSHIGGAGYRHFLRYGYAECPNCGKPIYRLKKS